MKILSGHINWHLGYANRPRFVLEVAETPDLGQLRYERRPSGMKREAGRGAK